MLKMNFIKKIVLLLNILVFSSCTKTQDDEKLRVLFLSGGGPEPNTSHNGNINHHKLKPGFLRNNMDIIFSSNLDDLNLNTLSNYDAIIMYLSARNEKPERLRALIEYVEEGGGLVALHNTSGAFDGDKDFLTAREKQVLKIYLKLNKTNQHKMRTIPICIIPENLK